MRCFALFSVVMFLTAPAAWAQAPVRLTLDEALMRGLDASHRLAEIGARQEAAQAVEDQRKAAARPQAALQAGYARTNHVQEFGIPGGRLIYPDIPDNLRSRVDLQWPIYTGGRTSALTRAAAAEADALGQDRDAARADLKLEITRAYWAVVTARASVEVVNAALGRIGAHLADIRAAFPKAKVDHSTETMFRITLARIPKSGGGRIQFAISTRTSKVTLIGVPSIPFCE